MDQTLNDRAWSDELRDGSPIQERAIKDLTRFLKGGLARSLAARTVVSDAFLEDVVQESLIRVLRNLDRFEGRSRFTTWAMAIAVRVAMSTLRRKHWQDLSLDQVLEGDELVPELGVDRSATPGRQVEQRRILETLKQLIESELTPKQRRGIQAELAGVPIPEIARTLGSNSNATYKLLHDARKRLQSGLRQAGYSAEHVASAFG